MNMNTGSLFEKIGKIFGRFHMTLFIVFIVGGLGIAVLFLNNILSMPPAADGYTSPIDAGSIDQATLERIRELHTSAETIPALALPTGRTNPFGE